MLDGVGGAGGVARFQAVAGGVGWIISLHFFYVFDAGHVADERGDGANQLDAIVGEEPLVGVKHLVHQHPAADAIVVGWDGPREAGGGEDVTHLVGDGGFVGAAGEGVGGEVDGVDFLVGVRGGAGGKVG